MSTTSKLNVKRDGPKYICPYCKSYYYLKTEAEACRDSCFDIMAKGGKLPEPKTPDLSLNDVIKHRKKK